LGERDSPSFLGDVAGIFHTSPSRGKGGRNSDGRHRLHQIPALSPVVRTVKYNGFIARGPSLKNNLFHGTARPRCEAASIEARRAFPSVGFAPVSPMGQFNLLERSPSIINDLNRCSNTNTRFRGWHLFQTSGTSSLDRFDGEDLGLMFLAKQIVPSWADFKLILPVAA